MTLPSISKNQQHILTLLYTYRFLTVPQVQQFIGQIDRRKLNRWLSSLRSKQYISWHYDTSFIGRTKPATYSLSINGIRWLRSTQKYPESELQKRHRDSNRTTAYIETCLMTATLALQMRTVTGQEHYTWVTPTDINTWGDRHLSLITLRPSLVFLRHTTTNLGPTTAVYLVELLRRTVSPLYASQRLRMYIRYIRELDWQESFVVPPTVLFVCPDKQSSRALKRIARRLLGEEIRTFPLRFTTLDILAKSGVRSPIWEHPAPQKRS